MNAVTQDRHVGAERATHARKTPCAPLLDAQTTPCESAAQDWLSPCGVSTPAPLTADETRHIHQPAYRPEFWERWILDRRVPDQGAAAPTASAVHQTHGAFRVCDAASLLARHQRLVVVAPHPDDEVLMCSGLLRLQAQHGGDIQIVALTDGEACFGPDTDRAAIGLQRRAEAAAGLMALGAANAEVHHFGLPDSALAAHETAAQQRLQALVQPGDLVVATWRLDGHPDHETAGRASAAACIAKGATLLEAPVWMWHWARPDHPAIDWSRLVSVSLSSDQMAHKWEAVQCHHSQLAQRGLEEPVIDAALQKRARWPFECFFTA